MIDKDLRDITLDGVFSDEFVNIFDEGLRDMVLVDKMLGNAAFDHPNHRAEIEAVFSIARRPPGLTNNSLYELHVKELVDKVLNGCLDIPTTVDAITYIARWSEGAPISERHKKWILHFPIFAEILGVAPVSKDWEVDVAWHELCRVLHPFMKERARRYNEALEIREEI